MNKKIHQSLKTGIAILGITSACVAGQAQTGILYTTHATKNFSKTCGYQNGQNVLQYRWLSAAEMPIYVDAVDQEIRQANWRQNTGIGAGHGYNLDGTPNGNVYSMSIPGQDVYDVGFDGENVYALNYSGSIYVLDKNYQNGQLLFTLPTLSKGITFDTATQTIWTTIPEETGTIQQWDLNGNLISSIQDSTPNSYGQPPTFGALAYDPSDDTLWAFDTYEANFNQYDKQGNLLGSFYPIYHAGGAEFAISPVIDCETLLAQVEQELDTALDEILNLDGQINQLNSDLQSAQQGLADCQSDLAQAQQDLATANATIADQAQEIGSLTQQNSALQGQLNVFDSSLQLLTSTLAANFQDPGFTIPGATTAEQLEALVDAIIDLNRGRQKGLYENLTGGGNKSDDEKSISKGEDEESKSKGKKSDNKKSGKKKD